MTSALRLGLAATPVRQAPDYPSGHWWIASPNSTNPSTNTVPATRRHARGLALARSASTASTVPHAIDVNAATVSIPVSHGVRVAGP